MGTWGTGIFSDDLAVDVRAAYRRALASVDEDRDATDRVVADHAWVQGTDEEPVFWLALAATQSQLGRLESRVRERALAVIDAGADELRWQEEGSDAVLQRRRVLDALRDRLVGPQPGATRVRRLPPPAGLPGDILAYRPLDGPPLLFRVVALRDVDRAAPAPIMQPLAWEGPELPSAQQAERLTHRPAPHGRTHVLAISTTPEDSRRITRVASSRIEPVRPGHADIWVGDWRSLARLLKS